MIQHTSRHKYLPEGVFYSSLSVLPSKVRSASMGSMAQIAGIWPNKADIEERTTYDPRHR
jgi:hypothetical protein